MKQYHVTVQLTNGGIESLDVELEDYEPVNYGTFHNEIINWEEQNINFYDKGLWSKGHIIAWSKIE